MRTPQTRVIDGQKYIVTPVGTRVGCTMLLQLKSLFTSGKSIDQVLGSVDDAMILFMIENFSKETRVLYEKKDVLLSNSWDEHFAGRYEVLLEWLAFCIEVNFKTFWDALPGLIEKAVAALGKAKETAEEAANSTS